MFTGYSRRQRPPDVAQRQGPTAGLPEVPVTRRDGRSQKFQVPCDVTDWGPD